ncbi:MAG: ribosome silencing factor [Rhizobiales bacterium]|nr:ribosome silencing factor [Hyphomicrobiales bacterium]
MSTPLSLQASVSRPEPVPPAGDAAGTLALILAQLEDAKAEETTTIDLTGKTAIADTMVVTSGRSNRQVGAIADRLTTALSEAGVKGVRVEGMPHCDWVLVDAGDVIVHIFRPEVRAFYNIEKMWSAELPKERRIG